MGCINQFNIGVSAVSAVSVCTSCKVRSNFVPQVAPASHLYEVSEDDEATDDDLEASCLAWSGMWVLVPSYSGTGLVIGPVIVLVSVHPAKYNQSCSVRGSYEWRKEQFPRKVSIISHDRRSCLPIAKCQPPQKPQPNPHRILTALFSPSRRFISHFS
jgi:hypothetical protein